VLDKALQELKGETLRELREICESTTRAEAMSKIDFLAVSFSKDYPKVAACIRDDVDRMLAYFAFPKASWKSLRTTNPIESVSASVRLPTNVAKRLRSGASALYLVFKLTDRLSLTWRRIDGYSDRTCVRENCMK
jgi:putative transposase